MPKVLILGARAPVALDHARRFAHQGWTVCVGDSISCRLSGWSQAVTTSIKLASPRFDPAQFITDLRQAIDRHAIDLVIPTCEEVFFLSRYRSALPSSCRVAVSDFEILRQLHSKWEFQSLARTAGGQPPASTLVSSLAQAREWAAGKPLVLKPEFSRFGVHVRIYPQGMPSQAAELPPMGRWVAQEYCAGTELCSYSIADQGRLLAHAVYRPAYRLHTSASYYFDQHVEQQASSAIQAFAATLVQQLQFTGQISFDWIAADGQQPRVLECNPRAISGVHLFAMQDALPAAFTGSADQCVVPSNSRARMIAPVMRSAGLLQALRRGQFAGWCSDAARADDVLRIGSDAMPILGALVDMTSFTTTALRRGCTLREAATSDIEWDGEELAWA